MAILNGNTDYEMKLSRGSAGQIILKFKNLNGPLTASAPATISWSAAGGYVDSGTMTVTGNANVEITKIINVKFFGQYKVKISTNRGYSYDHGFITPITMESGTDYHDYTPAELIAIKYGDEIAIGLASIALGTIVKATITIKKLAQVATYAIKAMGFLPTADEIFNIFTGDADPVPGSGWGIRTKITASASSITIKTQMYSSRNGTTIVPIGTEVTKILYPYPFE